MSTINKNLSTTMNNSISRLSNLEEKAVMSLLTPESYFIKKIATLANKVKNIKWNKRLKNAGITNADEIFTYTNTRELRALYNIALTCPQGTIALEIGSHFGASSCYIAAGLAQINGHLFCVDTWHNETMPEGEQDTFAEFQKNTNGLKQKITPVRKRSDEINDSDIKTPINFAFIDGDHSYISVKRDFELVKKWLAEDGIIAFHDFSSLYFEGVTRVIGEALASGKWITVGQVDTLVWIQRAKWL